MADYGGTPRHKFVIGVYNPYDPDPGNYLWSHNFDFVCTFISRPQLQNEILFPPNPSQLIQVLCKNALLTPSGLPWRVDADWKIQCFTWPGLLLHGWRQILVILLWHTFQPRYVVKCFEYVSREKDSRIWNAGMPSIIIPPPRHPTGIHNYASVLNSILRDTQVQVNILLPLAGDPSTMPHDEGSTWQVWNTIQTLTNYNPRLSVALQIPKNLPSKEMTRQWLAEPVRLLLCSSEIFLSNEKGYPVLSNGHQELLKTFMKVKFS